MRVNFSPKGDVFIYFPPPKNRESAIDYFWVTLARTLMYVGTAETRLGPELLAA